jgi:hypothetical protein
MPKILEKRELVIKGRVLTLANVRILAGLIERESKALPLNQGRTPTLTFSAETKDGSSFQSSDIDLFSDDSIVARKRVESISMGMSNYPTESRIQIELQHGQGYFGNRASVGGTDSKWVNGIIKEIEEVTESFAPQESFVLRHTSLGNLCTSVSVLV